MSRLRLSPCSRGFADVIRHFDDVFNQGANARDAQLALEAIAPPGGLADGYARRRPGLEWSSIA